MEIWFFAEKQTSIFIEFFNSIGTSRTLAFRSWASALEKILLVDAAKSEFLAFLPKLVGDFSKGDTENRIVGGRERHIADVERLGMYAFEPSR